MGAVKRKISSKAGETLIETLVAVLVVALSSIILVTMTVTASHLNAAARTADQAFYAELSAAESGTGSTATGTITVSWTTGSQSFSVDFVGSGSELKSYTYTGGGG
jgi:Tfp pilus assembly protein PilV